jgi:4-hydroxythreonine-4-phosphate dehydrogenase
VKHKPIIAITMGDPAGVGPEVVVKALNHGRVQSRANCLIIGNQAVLEKAAAASKVGLDLAVIDEIGQMDPSSARIHLLEQPPSGDFPVGTVDARCGQAAVNYILRAVDLALTGIVHAVATAPINKAALHAAGIPFKGHTELLADRTGSRDVAMMLVTPGRGDEPQWLRVTHATTHIPLRDVAAALSVDRILKTVELTQTGLSGLGIKSPRMALAAFNPHASDSGLMGDEESRVLVPAVTQAKRKGYDLAGPIPADTVFLRAAGGEFDAVIALYHDQGHIPIKTHGFERAVNITLGLPIIRTSVDHGTAFDIAWKNLADEASMVEAIILAADMSGDLSSRREHVA